MSDIPLTGEVSNSKLAAVFDSRDAARSAELEVIIEAGLSPAQVKLITPNEPHPGIKMEPEGGGIWRGILLAHAWLGAAGFAAGLLAFALLAWLGVAAVVQSPWAAGLAIVAFGGVAGMFVGGFVSLRPDHDRYVLATREAMAEGRITVVVHALSSEELDRAETILSRRGGQVTRTL